QPAPPPQAPLQSSAPEAVAALKEPAPWQVQAPAENVSQPPPQQQPEPEQEEPQHNEPEPERFPRGDVEMDFFEDTLDMKFHVEKAVDPNLGKLIAGRYTIVSEVGKGGMGVVYRADHSNIDRVVAIKMLHPHIVADVEVIKRFQAEA